MLPLFLSLTWALDFIKASSPSFRLDTHTYTHNPQQLFGRQAQTRRKGCNFESWTSHDWAVMANAEQKPAAEVTSVKTLTAPPEGICILSGLKNKA